MAAPEGGHRGWQITFLAQPNAALDREGFCWLLLLVRWPWVSSRPATTTLHRPRSLPEPLLCPNEQTAQPGEAPRSPLSASQLLRKHERTLVCFYPPATIQTWSESHDYCKFVFVDKALQQRGHFKPPSSEHCTEFEGCDRCPSYSTCNGVEGAPLEKILLEVWIAVVR